MSDALVIPSAILRHLSEMRGVTINDIQPIYRRCQEGKALNLQQLEHLGSRLCLTLDQLASEAIKPESHLHAGVFISRNQIRFDRLKMVDETPAYFYRHILKTPADPHLMVLRTSVLTRSPETVILNEGHQAKELVYVISGTVCLVWQGTHGDRRQDFLSTGDSAFIEPWTPHAFCASEPGSQILAIDYR